MLIITTCRRRLHFDRLAHQWQRTVACCRVNIEGRDIGGIIRDQRPISVWSSRKIFIIAGVNLLMRRVISRKTLAISVEARRLLTSLLVSVNWSICAAGSEFDGHQFLVGGLQLLLGSFKLLVSALEAPRWCSESPHWRSAVPRWCFAGIPGLYQLPLEVCDFPCPGTLPRRLARRFLTGLPRRLFP